MNLLLTPEDEISPLSPRPIREQDYSTLFKLDQAVYPTAFPVTADIVNRWYKKNPKFGIIFPGEEPVSMAGIFAVIPLSRAGWENLTSGKLTETEMDETMIFNPDKDTELGIHNYHIENLTRKKGFHIKALTALGDVIESLRPKVKLLGFSAYAVTKAGVNLHENKFRMSEKTFFSKEHVIEERGVLRVAKLEPEEAKNLEEEGVIVNRCKMLITTPNEENIVWEYLKR